MRVRILFFCIIVNLILVGCASNANDDPAELPMQQRTKEQIKFSTVNNQTGTDQQPANRTKEVLNSFDELTNIYAVNSLTKLLIAVDVAHHHRFQLKEIRDNIKLRIEKEFPLLDVHVSTDQKIQLELQDLEKSLQNNNKTSFDIEQEVDEILSLSKEQT